MLEFPAGRSIDPSDGKRFSDGNKLRIWYFRPIIPLTLCYALGIFMGASFVGFVLPVTIFALCSGWLVIRVILRSGECILSPLFLFFFLGYLSIQSWSLSYSDFRDILGSISLKKQLMEGVVEDVLKEDSLRLSLKVSVRGIWKRRSKVVPESVRLTIFGKRSFDIRKKDRIRFRGKISPFRNFYNPHGFNYERYMAFRGMLASVHSSSEDVVLLSSGPVFPIDAILDRFRKKVSFCISAGSLNVGASDDAKAFLESLVLGDRRNLTLKVKEAFSRTGTGHILAISGLHIGMVSFFTFFTLLIALKRIPLVLRHGAAFPLSAILSLFPVLAYAVISGMSPSTQRAVVMTGVFLLTFIAGRRYDLLNTFFVAAILILMVHPPYLFSVSFQFSFMAVLFILLGMPLFLRSELKSDDRMLRKAWLRAISFFSASLMATLGVLPLTMHYYHMVSLSGLLANVVVVPLICFLVLPLSLFSAWVSIFSPLAGMLGFSGALIFSDALLWFIYAVSSFPFSSLLAVSPSFFEMLLFYGAFIVFFNRRKISFSGRILLVIAFLFLLDGFYWTKERFLFSGLRVSAIDVGQGSASLVELPAGKTILIDGGGFSNNDYFDVGRYVVAPFLLKKKIVTLDFIILTHPNSDHMNGLIYILERFNVKCVWTNGDSQNTLGYSNFEKTLLVRKIKVVPVLNLDRNFIIGGAAVNILYPPKDFLRKRTENEKYEKNIYSLVTKITYKHISFLFPGDITQRTEKELILLNPGSLSESTVLFSPHHGSRTSSSMDFLEAVVPKVIVVSAGWNNRFGFPHEEVLGRYEKSGARVLRTDQCGAVLLETDGNKLFTRTVLKGKECLSY